MEEALTIAGQLHSASSAEIASWQSALADMLERREKPDAAEPHARLALAYWEKENPNQWQRFWAKFQLGIISLRQDRETEAQALLESGYQGLEQRRQDIPSADMRRLILALQRLADCYAAHGRPLQATEWKHKLLSFNELVNPAQRSQLPKEGSKDP
jgi:hypothetical protein